MAAGRPSIPQGERSILNAIGINGCLSRGSFCPFPSRSLGTGRTHRIFSPIAGNLIADGGSPVRLAQLQSPMPRRPLLLLCLRRLRRRYVQVVAEDRASWTRQAFRKSLACTMLMISWTVPFPLKSPTRRAVTMPPSSRVFQFSISPSWSQDSETISPLSLIFHRIGKELLEIGGIAVHHDLGDASCSNPLSG